MSRSIKRSNFQDEITCHLAVKGLINKVHGNVYVISVFILGHYGDVLRVKILFNKKDTALIQFTDSSQAQTGKN